MDPLARLTRTDKWFLGSGGGALYAPPFPRFLTAPGFWDEGYYADVRLPRLFTVLFRDARGRPIRLRGEVEEWRPDRLTLTHHGADYELAETRVVTPHGWVVELRRRRGAALHAVLWAMLERRETTYGAPAQTLVSAARDADALRAIWRTAWPESLEPDRTAVETERTVGQGAMAQPLDLHLRWAASQPFESWAVEFAQRHDESPLEALSPLPELFVDGRLPGSFRDRGGPSPEEGFVHLLGHVAWRAEAPLRFACDVGIRPTQAPEPCLGDEGLAAHEAAWRSFFGQVPGLRCADPYLEGAYYARWAGLRLNTIDVPGLPIAGQAEPFAPFIAEGIGFFRNFVTYSAQAHLREVAWLRDPRLAIGILDNLGRVQRADGSFPGHNYSARPARDFYHADFGTGVAALHARHPGAVRREHLATLRRYADYLLRHRTRSKDPAGPTLYDIFDQNETGQEYMSRYQVASENADAWGSFRVGGIDATVYAERLFATLAGSRGADSPYRAFAEGARAGLRQLAFDPESAFFCDEVGGARSPARPATGLYAGLIPELADLAMMAMDRWMLNPDEFWLPAGFPATAKSDPTFSAEGRWKDKRLNCPWNGRSWPMANSHLVDSIATVGRTTGDQRMLAAAGQALRKAIRLLFHEGDPGRPCSYEHYNPITGTPSLYRGYDDYMHSWVVDLILRHAAGLVDDRPEARPLPNGPDGTDLEWLEVEGAPVGGELVSVRWRRGESPTVDREPNPSSG